MNRSFNVLVRPIHVGLEFRIRLGLLPSQLNFPILTMSTIFGSKYANSINVLLLNFSVKMDKMAWLQEELLMHYNIFVYKPEYPFLGQKSSIAWYNAQRRFGILGEHSGLKNRILLV